MPLMSLAALMLLANSAPLVVRVADGPASGRCQPTDPLAETLRRRMPGLRVVSGEGAGQHDIEISLASAPAGWRLDVRRADRLGALTRDVPVGPGACVDVVETSALIVERYLREIRWSGRPLALGDVGGDEPELRANPPAPPPHEAAGFRRTRIAVGLGSRWPPRVTWLRQHRSRSRRCSGGRCSSQRCSSGAGAGRSQSRSRAAHAGR